MTSPLNPEIDASPREPWTRDLGDGSRTYNAPARTDAPGPDGVRRQVDAQLEAGKRSAVAAVNDVSDALGEGAAALSARGQESLAEATSTMAEQLSRLSRSLQTRSIDDLVREARALARRRPALFVAGGVAVGFALSRYFTSSAPGPGTDSARHHSGGRDE